MCLCVCLSILSLSVITCYPFKSGSPNLDKRCRAPCLKLLSFLGVIDLDLMMTLSNANILHQKFTGHRWIPSQRPVMRSFDVFFDLRLNIWLSKSSRHRWFEIPPCSLWSQCNVKVKFNLKVKISLCLVSPLEQIHLPLEKIHNSHGYLDCCTVRTVSQSPSSTHTHIPRLLHGPECFAVSNICTYADLGSQGYFSV